MRTLKIPAGFLRQGVGYGAVGIAALLVDWASFVGLTRLGIGTAESNLVARLCGAGVAFVLNGAFTFRDDAGVRLGWRRLLRYAIIWLILTAASTVAMQWIQAEAGLRWAWLAKPGVEVVLAGLSFLSYRYWIYK